MLPKHNVDCTKNELARGVRSGAKKQLEFYSFIIPSRQGGFQESFYPPFISPEPANTAEEWAKGVDVEPKTMALRPQAGEKKQKGKLGGKLGASKPSAAAAAAESTAASADTSAL